LRFSVLKSTFKQFHLNILKNLGFTRICREIVNVAIYALYPESFCRKNLAVQKIFAFSDSGIDLVVDLIDQMNMGPNQ